MTLYETLGVRPNSTAAEIKKAHRALLLREHPDKGGDPEEFQKIQHAFDILGDERKREIYDSYGEEGVAQAVMGPKPREKKGKDLVQPVKVSLEQVYQGKTRTLRVTRSVIDKTAKSERCGRCNGRGHVFQTVRMGPMVQQIQGLCEACGGQGSSTPRLKVKEILEVHIPCGAPDGHQMRFYGKADEIPNGEPGDVVLVLEEQPHPEFKRRGDDLYLERTISLTEALCGFSMQLTHLDGRKLLIRSAPGEVLAPTAVDPFAEAKQVWTAAEGFDCPDLKTVAVSKEELSSEECKRACTSGQLRDAGVTCFVQHGGTTTFKKGTHSEVSAAKVAAAGSQLFTLSDPLSDPAARAKRMMKGVVGEGLPRSGSPCDRGNLFILLSVEFPSSLGTDMQEALRQMLPSNTQGPLPGPALDSDLTTGTLSATNGAEAHGDDGDGEVVLLSDMDPVQSHAACGQPVEDDDANDASSFHGAPGVACAQQ